MEPMLFTKAQVADYLGITILSLNKYISFDPCTKIFPNQYISLVRQIQNANMCVLTLTILFLP